MALQQPIVIDLEQEPIIFDYINNGITITDQHSHILYTNPVFTKITGYSKEEAKGESPGMLHSGRHNKTFYEAMWKQISETGFWEGEIWNRRKSGEIYPELLTVSKIEQGSPENYFYMAVFSDITFLEKDVEQKLHLAFYDPLTELPNRNLYLDRINQALESIDNKKETAMAVFFMDLDKFKAVNDTYGHCVGDTLLKLVGERLSAIVRSGDTIARLGGDEFTAVLIALDEREAALHFAKRIVESLEKPFSIDGHTINISVSIGISFYRQDADTAAVLMKEADAAMYSAKKNKTQIVVYQKTD